MPSKLSQTLDALEAGIVARFPGVTFARGEGAIAANLPNPRCTWVRTTDAINTGPKKLGTNPRIRAVSRTTVVAHLVAADDTLEALEHALVLTCQDYASGTIEYGDAEWITTGVNKNAEAVLLPLTIPIPITEPPVAEAVIDAVGTDAPAPSGEPAGTLHCGDP